MKSHAVVALALAALALAGCGQMPLSHKQEPAAPPAPQQAPATASPAQPVQAKPAPSAPAPQASKPIASRPAIVPIEKYSSLQPFKRFKKGEGEGMAYVYKPRTKAQLIAILRDRNLAKKEMRVSCEVLVRQMMEGHPELPFEGCEGAAAALASDDFTVAECRDEMFRRNNWLTVTDQKVTAFGAWHRGCLWGEKVLKYKGQPILSLTCLNVAIPVASKRPPSLKMACVEIPGRVEHRRVVRVGLLGPAPIDDECFAVKVAGETDFQRPWQDLCPDIHCGFSGPVEVVGQPLRKKASFVAEPGEFVVRLSAKVAEPGSKYVTALCLEEVETKWPTYPTGKYGAAEREQYIRERDKWIRDHSDAIGVRWDDYRDVGGIKQARVHYTKERASEHRSNLYFTWGLWHQNPAVHRQYWDARR